MKITKQPPPIDQQLMARYAEVCRAHPDTILVPMASKDSIHGNVDRAIRGELVHTIVKHGPLLLVKWIPTSDVRWIFDAYGQ